MNILLISYYHGQAGSGGTERSRAMFSRFTEAGQRVTVVTAGYRGDRRDGPCFIMHDPSHNRDRGGANYLHWLGRRAAVEGRLRAGLYASVLSSWLRRAKRAAEEILSMAAPDVILATYPPVEDLQLGLFLHERSGIPLVAEFRDGLAFEPVERRATGFRAVRRQYERLEREIAREAAAIVTVSPPLSRYFEEKLGCRTVRTIPNGHDAPPRLVPLEPTPFPPGYFHIVHTGGISLSDRGCDLSYWVRGVGIVLADSPALGRRLRLHFAGRLTRRERRLLRPLAAAGLARLYGPVARETALWMQRQAQLLLLLTSGDRASVATAKLFEYMQARRPVLAMAAGTFAAEIIAQTGIGWAVPAGSPEDAATALAAIMTGELAPPGPDERAIALYSRQAQCADYLSLLAGLNRWGAARR
jgi:glycosyltransferase involved in cell wall biosynthesis